MNFWDVILVLKITRKIIVMHSHNVCLDMLIGMNSDWFNMDLFPFYQICLRCL